MIAGLFDRRATRDNTDCNSILVFLTSKENGQESIAWTLLGTAWRMAHARFIVPEHNDYLPIPPRLALDKNANQFINRWQTREAS